LPAFAKAAQKPSQGKVLIHVSADTSGVYKGVQQRAPDLEESARDVRKSLKNDKWLEVTENEEEADIRLRILGRRLDPEKGFALGYALDAGAYKTEDEFLYVGESIPTGGGRSRDAREMSDAMQPRQTLGYSELAKKFGQSLEQFAASNYDRIVAQRKPHPN
jgi:hypothetical protein